MVAQGPPRSRLRSRGAKPKTKSTEPTITPARRESFCARASQSVGFVALFALVIVGKVAYEATFARNSRMRLADRIMPSGRAVHGEPGPIYASGGEVLADAVARYAICANPASFESQEQREDTAQQLAAATGVKYGSVLKSLSRPERSFCYIDRQVPPSVEDKVADLHLAGVFTQNEMGRVYPFGPLAANAIGMRGDDGTGLMGIERLWAFCLDGSPSSARANFDRFGRTILGSGPGFIPEEPGRHLVLTVRMPLQKVVEAAMDEIWENNKPESATCTVMDAGTGNILAISVRPNFNPNDTSTAQPDRTRCRPAADVYAPGSTLKTAIVSAALDAGVITPDTRFYCSGTTTIGKRPLGCWGEYRIKGHGSLTPRGVITGSCNIAAAQIALKLGKERLYKYLDRMHIQDTMASGLAGEQPGRLLPPDQQRIRGVANIGFGQGIDITDLHMVAIYGAIANDGMMLYPNVVREARGADGHLIHRREPSEAGRLFKPETCDEMLSYLEANVQHGTGHSAAIEGVRVGGKTGTAQIFDHENGRFFADEYVMSFAAIAPIEDPQFVVVVRVTRPKVGAHASDTAAPAAKRALEAAFRLGDSPEA